MTATPWDILDDALGDLQDWRQSGPAREDGVTLQDFGEAALSPDRRRLLTDLVMLIERWGKQFPQLAVVLHAMPAAHIEGQERELATLILDHFMHQIANPGPSEPAS